MVKSEHRLWPPQAMPFSLDKGVCTDPEGNGEPQRVVGGRGGKISFMFLQCLSGCHVENGL